MGSRSKSFIVSESGHIAGIVNPPSKKKYGHYTNADLKGDSTAWMEQAEFQEGSWWPRWQEWLKKRSGKQVPAREVGDSGHPKLWNQHQGSYVKLSKQGVDFRQVLRIFFCIAARKILKCCDAECDIHLMLEERGVVPTRL